MKIKFLDSEPHDDFTFDILGITEEGKVVRFTNCYPISMGNVDTTEGTQFDVQVCFRYD
jgi:hypothetical protein